MEVSCFNLLPVQASTENLRRLDRDRSLGLCVRGVCQNCCLDHSDLHILP